MQDDDVAALLENQDSILQLHQHYVKNVLNLGSGARAILCNGRVIGPLDNDEEFTNEDFSLLERFSQSTYGAKLFMRLLKDQFFNDDEYGTTIDCLNFIILIIQILYIKHTSSDAST